MSGNRLFFADLLFPKQMIIMSELNSGDSFFAQNLVKSHNVKERQKMRLKMIVIVEIVKRITENIMSEIIALNCSRIKRKDWKWCPLK